MLSLRIPPRTTLEQVLANRGTQILNKEGVKVHPNDHCNKGQSSNDSFPTAMSISCVEEVHKRLLPGLVTYMK